MQEQCVSLWDRAATVGLLSFGSTAQSLQDVKWSRYPAPAWENVFPVFLKPCIFSSLLQVCLSCLPSSPYVCRWKYLSRRFISSIILPKVTAESTKRQSGVGLSPHTGSVKIQMLSAIKLRERNSMRNSFNSSLMFASLPAVRGGPAVWRGFCELDAWTATQGGWALPSAGHWFQFAARKQGLLAHLHTPGKDTQVHNVASFCF